MILKLFYDKIYIGACIVRYRDQERKEMNGEETKTLFGVFLSRKDGEWCAFQCYCSITGQKMIFHLLEGSYDEGEILRDLLKYVFRDTEIEIYPNGKEATDFLKDPKQRQSILTKLREVKLISILPQKGSGEAWEISFILQQPWPKIEIAQGKDNTAQG